MLLVVETLSVLDTLAIFTWDAELPISEETRFKHKFASVLVTLECEPCQTPKIFLTDTSERIKALTGTRRESLTSFLPAFAFPSLFMRSCLWLKTPKPLKKSSRVMCIPVSYHS